MSASIVTLDSQKALYIPVGYAARTMMIGSTWTKINLGVRINFRITTTNYPHDLPASGKRVWVGLCSGTTNPVGVVTPAHFIGYRSSRTPILEPVNGGFVIGYSIVSVQNGSVTIQQTDAHVDNRVMIQGQTDAAQQGGSAIIQCLYLQFEKLSSVSMKVTLLRPPGSGIANITESQFVTAVETETLSSAISGHSTYETNNVTFAYDQTTYGDLTAVNLMTDIADQTSGDKLASLRWHSVKVHKFS